MLPLLENPPTKFENRGKLEMVARIGHVAPFMAPEATSQMSSVGFCAFFCLFLCCVSFTHFVLLSELYGTYGSANSVLLVVLVQT